ncbi:aminopeptidase [Dimargaris verticillata]|uniref:Aminopeptidase n=1 Tax=Dimargaris verticillata TaxID=2761393 RepID=A0A9W8E8A2_9FUNG|nr:aminopeptidase [Dimargaris verticillata]
MTHGLVWASRTLGRPRVLHQRLTAPLRNATAQVLAAPKLARQPCRLATRTLITTAHRQSLHRSPLKYMGQPTSETHPHLVQAGHITPGITSDEYAQRRARLAEALPENSVVIVFGHPLSFKATHVFYPFRQQSDFFYLTGFNEPDAVLLIEKGAHSGSAVTSTLFVPPQDDASERWEGPRAGIDGVRSYFGDYEAYPIKELEQVLQRVLARRPGSVQRASSQTDGSAVVSLSSLVSNLRSRPETSATDSLQVYADIPLNYTLRSSQHVVHSVLKHRHYLGLDVHDTMDVSRNLTLKDGMVVTIEPGLYVPFDDRFPSRYQGIGIRIEDNIVVRRSAPLNLSKQVPKEIVDIEALVKP